MVAVFEYLLSQAIIFTILLGLALIAGGAASAAQAADVQDDYVDPLQCDDPSSNPIVRALQDRFCDDFEQLRNSQAAAAVSYIYASLYLLVNYYSFTTMYSIIILCSYSCLKVLIHCINLGRQKHQT